ncbi:MAG: hypothetical protein WKF43_00685 [Acidimicrobiales bacterium]
MRMPGVETRPILTMAGETGFSELFFTDARVPVSAILGQLNDGWNVATTTLSNERAGRHRLGASAECDHGWRGRRSWPASRESP